VSKNSKRYSLLTIAVCLFFAYFLISVPYFSGDVKNHIVWGRSILEEGPAGFYGRYFHDYSFPNYPPISMLSFATSVWLFDISKSLVTVLDKIPFFPSALVVWLNYENVEISFLKIPAILPFILSGVLVFYFSRFFKRNPKESLISSLLFLFNPAFVYLAVIWGQNDFTQVLFILLSIYFLLKESFYPLVIFAALSILSKQTALMVWALILHATGRVFGYFKFAVGVGVSLILIWLFYLPFNNTSLVWPFTFYAETLRTTGLLVSDNAVNFWGLFARFLPADSQEIISGLKLEYWGFILFGLLFLPVFYKYLKTKFSPERFIYFLFMASIIYFFALTRMHERYIIFGVVFAHLLTVINRKYWFNLVFFSALLFLNMYKGLLMPDIPILVGLVNSQIFLGVLGCAYLAVLCFNYYYFIYALKDEKD
jgi:hypothetical protein